MVGQFNPGDTVRCKEPVGVLEKDALYKIISIGHMIYGTDSANAQLFLDGIDSPYYAFRFELAEKSEAPPAVANVMLEHLDTTVDTWVNDIDSGLVASKHDNDKPDLSLIPYVALIEEAKAFMVGERKYGRLNYLKGHKSSQLIAAAMRHLLAWNEGEETDPVDGQHHLGSVRACCAMILRQMEIKTLKDNRK